MLKENTKKKLNVLWTVLFCLALTLFILTFAIALPIYGRFFYYLQIDALELDRQSGFTFSQIKRAYDEVLNFCTLPWVKQFSAGSLKFSEEGAAHFADCKVLFNLNFAVLTISFAATAVFVVLHKCKVIALQKIKGHRPYIISAAAAILLPLVVMLLVASVSFDKAFEAFHAVFFPGKENWQFNPYEDEIILVMPQEFFANCAVIIAAAMIGFSAALVAADFALIKREKQKRTRPAEFYLFTALIIAETGVYIAFNTITFAFNKDTNAIKYFGILTCFTVAVVNCFSNRKDCFFVAGAMLFTAIADLFLLMLDGYSECGVGAFIVVQLLYFARIYYAHGKKPWISGAVRIGIAAMIIIILAATGKLNLLTALTAFYLTQIVANIVDSAFIIKYSKRNILFFIGLILFLCCDLCVGLFNFSEVGITLPAALEKVIAPAIWLFYLPSQVLITISAGANEKQRLIKNVD